MFPSIFRENIFPICELFTQVLLPSAKSFGTVGDVRFAGEKAAQLNGLWRSQQKSFEEACNKEPFYFESSQLSRRSIEYFDSDTLKLLFNNAASHIYTELTTSQASSSVDDSNWTFAVMKRAKELPSGSMTPMTDKSLVSFFRDKISRGNLEGSDPFYYYKVLIGFSCKEMALRTGGRPLGDLLRDFFIQKITLKTSDANK